MLDDSSISTIIHGLKKVKVSDIAGIASEPEYYDHNKPALTRFWLSVNEAESAAALADFTFDIEHADREKKIDYKIFDRLKELCSKVQGDKFAVVDTRSTKILRASLQADKPSSMPDGVLFARPYIENGQYVVGFFDYKKSLKKFGKKQIGQIMSYAHRLLAVEQPERGEITGFLINDKSVLFLKAICAHSGQLTFFMTEESSVQRKTANDPIPMGLHFLFSFFKSAPYLGYKPVVHPFGPRYPHSSFLGTGKSSRVFAISGEDNKDKVMKLLTDAAEAENEARTLTNLAEWKIPHVPKLIAHADKALILTPRAREIATAQFSRRHALQVLKTLKCVHERGIVHRDIRPANLMFVDKDVLVNDWGYSVEINKAVEYCGTLIHASNRVLQLLGNKESVFPVTAADDLESFVRTTFVLTFPRAAIHQLSKMEVPEAANKLLDFWNNPRLLPTRWVEMQQLCRECKYQEIEDKLKELIP